MIDVSGDGANNQGRPVTHARDEAIAKGITINGLPIMLKKPGSSTIRTSTSTSATASSAVRAPSWCRPVRGRSSNGDQGQDHPRDRRRGTPEALDCADAGAISAQDHLRNGSQPVGELMPIARCWRAPLRSSDRLVPKLGSI